MSGLNPIFEFSDTYLQFEIGILKNISDSIPIVIPVKLMIKFYIIEIVPSTFFLFVLDLLVWKKH